MSTAAVQAASTLKVISSKGRTLYVEPRHWQDDTIEWVPATDAYGQLGWFVQKSTARVA